MSDGPAYVIQCTGFCGRVILTREEYLRQLQYADHGWVCPGCKRPAIWVNAKVESVKECGREK